MGYSDAPAKRLGEHNTDPRMTYTHKYRPWILKTYYPVNENRGDAMKVERFIKRQKSRRFIVNLIEHPEIFEDIIKKVLR